MTDERNMLGFHFQKNLGAPFNGAFERLLDTPMAVCTFVGNATEYPYLDALYVKQPDCLIIGRDTPLESLVGKLKTEKVNPEAAAAEYVKQFDSVPYRPKYVYWIAVSPEGEWGGGEEQDWEWLARFDLEFAKLMNDKGYRVGLGNMSEGNPPEMPYNPKFSDIWTRIYKPVLDHIQKVGPKLAIFQRHCYRIKCFNPAEDAAHFLRLKLLYDYLESQGMTNVMIALGETGPDVNGEDQDGWMSCPVPDDEPDPDLWRFNKMKEINSMLSPYKRLYGGAWYTFDGSSDGKGSYRVIEAVFNLWQIYAKTLKVITPIPGQTTPVPTPEPTPIVTKTSVAAYTNGLFDKGYTKLSADQDVPDGWSVWSKVGVLHVEDEMHPTHTLPGNIHSARFWVGGEKMDGGLYQVVNVTNKKKYEFDANVFLWSTNDPQVDTPSQFGMTGAIGIDPTGAVDPYASTVIWSDPMTSIMDRFTHLSLTATAQSDKMTVFLRAISLNRVARSDSFWSTTELWELSAASETPTPTPVPEPHGVAAKCITGLNLRCGPSTGYDVLKVMPAGSSVKVVGPGNNAQLKLLIGSQNWLVVIHEGDVGYCAGWYLK